MSKTIENTLENKAKFFALYLGSLLAVPLIPKYHYYPFSHNEGGLLLDGLLGTKIIVKRIAEQVEDRFHQCSLELKPLSSISDEDALFVFDLYNEKNQAKITKIYLVSDKYLHIEFSFIGNEGVRLDNGITVSPQSLGYDAIMKLTKLGYHVGSQNEVEYGWVKLKED